MASQQSSWSTTFFWEQDLRSLYMNGLLNSVLKPGIYNANIGIFATTGTPELAPTFDLKTPGVYLYLKRGTTFVFSNNYLYKDSQIIPEFENSGNFLIKSVVLQDTCEPIIQVTSASGQTGSATADLKAFFGYSKQGETAYQPLPEIYLTAMMKFNGEGALDTNAGYDSKPVFSWAANKGDSYINATSQGLDDLDADDGPFNFIASLITQKAMYSDYGYNYYFLDATTLNQSKYYDHLFPAEGKANSEIGPASYLRGSKYDRTSYLMVGRCLRVRSTIGADTAYIGDNGAWQSLANSSGASAWNRDYVFTASGLSAYRQEQSPGQVSLRPSLMPVFDHGPTNKDFNAKLNTDKAVIDTDPNSASPKNNFSKFTFNLKDLSIKNKLWSAAFSGDYYTSLVLCNSSTVSGTPTYRLVDYSNKQSELSKPKQTIIDFFYLLLKEKLDRAQGIDKKDLLNSEDFNFEAEIKQFDFITANEQIFNQLCQVAPVTDSDSPLKLQYESTNLLLGKSNIPTSRFTSGTASNAIEGQNIGLGEALSPLDISPLNIQRLQTILESSNFLNNVIDYFRQKAPAQLRLNNGSTADILVPLALTFRPILNDNGHFKSGDGVATLAGLVNPANVLDFFSLQAQGSKVHTVSLGDNDLYTILPVMN